MKTVGDKLEPFKVAGVKPGFNDHEENGVSAFEDITESSFPGKWKVIYFYPKDFTFVCPTEIVGFNALAQQFEDHDAVLLAGSSDNEYVKLAWRREHAELSRLAHYQFGDTTGALIDQLGIRERAAGVALRATFIVDPENIIQHVSVNNLATAQRAVPRFNHNPDTRHRAAWTMRERVTCRKLAMTRAAAPGSRPGRHAGQRITRVPAAPPRWH